MLSWPLPGFFGQLERELLKLGLILAELLGLAELGLGGRAGHVLGEPPRADEDVILHALQHDQLGGGGNGFLPDARLRHARAAFSWPARRVACE